MTKKEIGERVRAYRLQHHISQTEAADRIGISQQRLSAIERGKVDPRTSTIYKIMRGLDAPPNDFFGPLPTPGVRVGANP